MGSQQVCRGWTQIRAQEWAGEDCMGRVGMGRMREQGETWKKVDSEGEAGTQKHEGTEMRGPRETI